MRPALDVRADALHDVLTGLAGRTLLSERLHAVLAQEAPVAVLFVGLDRFKDLNDSFGHAAGDELLRQVAARLSAAAGGEDVVARFGGDEFVLVCRDAGGERGAIAAAERALAMLRAPLHYDERRLFVSASIGVVVAHGARRDAHGVLRDAGVAMQCAKDAGGGRYVLFDHAMRRRVVERVALACDLRTALERAELRLDFQPLVDLRDGRVEGLEALVRWEHPRLGLVPPGAFVPVAEDNGTIVEIGHWVLTEACRQLARWSDDPSLGDPYISVNLSGRQLAEPDLPELVADVLRRTGVAPHRLALELTETVLIGETASPTAVLQRLKALGVRLLLDDFGTGYSSLNYLKLLPLDGIKVDRSFIAGIAEGEEDRQILKAIVQLAGSLGLRVTAEGVETIEQGRWIHALGCQAAQGYLFAAPAAATAIELLLHNGVAPEVIAGCSAARPPAVPEMPQGDRAADEQTVPLGEAAEALGVSTSTLRRWADAGRIAAVRTSGGHRRFPVGEVQRLRSSTSLLAPPVVRMTPLPEGALPALAAVLAHDGGELALAAGRATYERGRIGWLAAGDSEVQRDRWVLAVRAAVGDGDHPGAVEATRALMRHGRYAGTPLVEREVFVERFGELALGRLQRLGADRAEMVATRRLFAHVRQALADEAPAGV